MCRRACGLQPDDVLHQFDHFFILTALGRQEEAQTKYDEIVKSSEAMRYRLDSLAARHVFDSLAAGQAWHPPDNVPEGTAFAAMHRAAEQYEQLAAVGKRVVAEGFHPSWSPDGKELAYSRGVLGSSGIEILNLQTGKTRLLTIPGKDPAWSPDGRYIAYVRDRQVLSLADLTKERQGEHRPFRAGGDLGYPDRWLGGSPLPGARRLAELVGRFHAGSTITAAPTARCIASGSIQGRRAAGGYREHGHVPLRVSRWEICRSHDTRGDAANCGSVQPRRMCPAGRAPRSGSSCSSTGRRIARC